MGYIIELTHTQHIIQLSCTLDNINSCPHVCYARSLSLLDINSMLLHSTVERIRTFPRVRTTTENPDAHLEVVEFLDSRLCVSLSLALNSTLIFCVYMLFHCEG